MRVVIAGTGRLGTAILEPLLDSAHEVVGLLLNGRRTRGAARRFFDTSMWFGLLDAPVRVARRRGIPVFWLDGMTETELAPIARLRPDLIITCGFGIILKRPLLELPAVGCINVHSSLLPRHRGPMPFNWVILSGDTETGVTFHVTTEAIDAGAILDQRAIPVTPHDTTLTLYRRCCELAQQRVAGVVDAIAAQGLLGTPQEESAASYDPPLAFSDLEIDWKRSAAEIDRVVRAGTPYLPAHFYFRGRRIEVDRCIADTAAAAGAEPGMVVQTRPYVRVATGEGTITLVRAAIAQPILWPWPNVFSGPRVGTQLD